MEVNTFKNISENFIGLCVSLSHPNTLPLSNKVEIPKTVEKMVFELLLMNVTIISAIFVSLTRDN